MSGRSNWEAKTSVLNRLDPSRRAEAEARAKARASRPTNEAIVVGPQNPRKPTSVEPKATPGLLGSGAATNAMRKIRSRLPE
jgi:hypothetical protein